MKKTFLVYGVVVCLLLAYSNFYGWKITDSFSSGKWGPHGKSMYHK